jgi:hypothetical protein
MVAFNCSKPSWIPPSATEDADVDVGVARRLSRRRNNDNAEEEDVPLETFPGTSTMTNAKHSQLGLTDIKLQRYQNVSEDTHSAKFKPRLKPTTKQQQLQ